MISFISISRRHLLARAAAPAGAAGTRAATTGSGLRLPTPTARAASTPHLILLQQPDETSRTPYIVEHIRSIERLPFDGMTIHIPASWSVMRGKPIRYEQMYDEWLRPLRGIFQRFAHNFLLAFNDNPGDLFNDDAWDTTITNFRLLARGAKAVGFAGIVFDNEEYGTPWHNYPRDYDAPTRSRAAYRDQARLRGRQIMAAMVEEFPTIRLLVLHGPYVSEPKTPPRVARNQVGDAREYDLLGPFFVGFVEGMGPQSLVIDGGEVYQYRNERDFARSYQWRKSGIASAATASAFIPPAIRDRWSDSVSIAFGVYNQSWPDRRQDQMTAKIMGRVLPRALARADDYVWVYVEDDPWLRPGGMPKDWRRAVRRAWRGTDE